MQVEQPHLAVVDTGVGILEVHPAFPKRFDLGAGQRDPRLDLLDEVVLEARLAILESLDHNYLEGKIFQSSDPVNRFLLQLMPYNEYTYSVNSI